MAAVCPSIAIDSLKECLELLTLNAEDSRVTRRPILRELAW